MAIFFLINSSGERGRSSLASVEARGGNNTFRYWYRHPGTVVHVLSIYKYIYVFSFLTLRKVERGRLTNGNRGITWWVKTFVISFCRVHGNLGFRQTHGCGPIHNGPRVGLNGALPAVDRRFF